jgi:hypothetical protein
MKKRPHTAACPHCNGRLPRAKTSIPKWLFERCEAQKARCQNPNHIAYPHYGGRGIRFLFDGPNEAAQWIEENLGIRNRSFEIDRIQNSGNYEPGNLQWATRSKQMNNTRTSDGTRRQRTVDFRKNYPHARYADNTLSRLMSYGLTDEEILLRWNLPSSKPKGKYGTFSPQGLYRGSLSTES